MSDEQPSPGASEVPTDPAVERDNLRALLAQAPAAFALVMGPEHRYVLSNPVNQQFAGGRPLVGKTVAEAMPELEAQGLVAMLDQVYRTGQPLVGHEVPVELAPTQTEPQRLAYLSGVYQPLRGSSGATLGVMAFAYEVTDLVLARQRAEQAEDRLRLALAAADVGTWDWEAQNNELVCDPRLRQLCGFPADVPLTLAAFLEAVQPEDRARLRGAVDRAFQRSSGGDYALEYRVRDGRWIAVRGRTFFDATGKPVRFSGAARDITEQRQTRERIERAERRARLIADALPQIAWLADREGRIVFFNRRWYDYTGAATGSVEPADWTEVVHPEDLANINASFLRSKLVGQPFQSEVRLRHADGSHRWHLARSLPLLDDAGTVTGWVGSSTDIDDRRREEDASRFLADASSLLSATLDTTRSLQRLVELAVPTLAEGCAIDLLAADDSRAREHFVAHVDRAMKDEMKKVAHTHAGGLLGAEAGHPGQEAGNAQLHPQVGDDLLVRWARDAEHLRRLRALHPRSALAVPIAARGTVLGTITLVVTDSSRRFSPADLTLAQALADRVAHAVENSRLYQEAQDAVRVRDDFMSIASHELKTPLTPLQLQVQSLQAQSREVLPEKMARKLDVIGRQVNRLERLVGSLLEISRLTGRGRSIELECVCEEVELTGLASDVAQRFRLELEHARSEFLLDAPTQVLGHWDQLRIDQIISNLLSNAIKFGPGKPIELRIEARDGVATIMVRDQGIGIGPGDQARIFERFEKAVPSRHYGGFGLGLWIVRQIVAALGGTIEVESALGAGSRFTVRLPQQPLPTATPGPDSRVH